MTKRGGGAFNSERLHTAHIIDLRAYKQSILATELNPMEKVQNRIALSVLEKSPLGVLVLDKNQTILYVNSTLCSILNIAVSPKPGAALETLPSAFCQGITTHQEVFDLPSSSANPRRTLKCWTEPLSADDQQVTVLYCLDMTEVHAVYQERDRLAEELARLTTRDSLTGLPNRQALFRGLEPLVSRSRRYSNPLSIIRLKLDSWSSLDGEHGTGSRDKAVVRVSQFLRDQVRWADMVGRLHDDEFLLILPETPCDAARALAEKLNEKIKDLIITGDNGEQFGISLRFGVASWKKGDDRKLLLNAAEKNMASGREGAAA